MNSELDPRDTADLEGLKRQGWRDAIWTATSWTAGPDRRRQRLGRDMLLLLGPAALPYLAGALQTCAGYPEGVTRLQAVVTAIGKPLPQQVGPPAAALALFKGGDLDVRAARQMIKGWAAPAPRPRRPRKTLQAAPSAEPPVPARISV